MSAPAVRRPMAGMLLAVLLLAIAGGTMAAEKKVPRVLWAQRNHVLYLKIVVPEMVEGTGEYRYAAEGMTFSAESTKDGGATYSIDLKFFRKIQPEGCFAEERSQDWVFILQKKWVWIYWPRLLFDPKDKNKAFVGVDWKRWKYEDDDNDQSLSNDMSHQQTLRSKGIDEAWYDEDLAQKKPAHFPEEMYDDLHLPLLNATTLTSFLNTEKQAAVLFFERDGPANMQWHKVMAAMAKEDDITKFWSFGSFDAGEKANAKLLKKLHMNKFPAMKLFYENGDMFAVEIDKIKSGKELKGYFQRQVTPAFRTLETWEEAEMFMEKYPRVALGFVNQDIAPDAVVVSKKKAKASYEQVFEMVAKRFRARVEPQMVKFGKINVTMPEALEHFNKSSNYTGVLVVKNDDAIRVREFKGKLKEKTLYSWTYSAQFNMIEFITPHNFADFRARNLPILYVILNDEESKQMLDNNWKLTPLLESLQAVAAKNYGKLSFVFTFQNDPRMNAKSLTEHLRCDYHGETFAVLEDFHQDYRYCVETFPERPLTSERVDKLVAEVLDNVAEPDKVRSELPPKENPGPVFKVVADNLLKFVMEDRDVIIHFFSAIDDEWEYQEYQLNRFADEVEDQPKLRIGRMDGLKNERPKSFPDLGYFPCTWIFPRFHKSTPVPFNKTFGFDKERLMDWTRRTVDESITPNGMWPNGTKVDTEAWDSSGRTTLPDYFLGEPDPNVKPKASPEIGDDAFAKGPPSGGGGNDLPKGGAGGGAGGRRRDEL